MTTAHFDTTTYGTPDAEAGLSAPAPERALARVWRFLVDAGQRRAANELARYVRLHGGRRQATSRKTLASLQPFDCVRFHTRCSAHADRDPSPPIRNSCT